MVVSRVRQARHAGRTPPTEPPCCVVLRGDHVTGRRNALLGPVPGWSTDDTRGPCHIGSCLNIVAVEDPDSKYEGGVDAVRQGDREASVHDHVALHEIELYGEVLSAVAATERSLTQDEIDAVLGVESVSRPG